MPFLLPIRDSWDNLNRAEPMEMVIERKSLSEMKLVDYNLTGTVRETPLFIGKLAEGLPTQHDIGFCEVIHGATMPRKNCSPRRIARNVCPRAFKRVMVSSTL